MKNRVAITRCGKYDYSEIKKSMYLLIENSDFPDVKGKKVLVKPNILSDSKEEKNITTNPLVVKAVIEIVKERGSDNLVWGLTRYAWSQVSRRRLWHLGCCK